MVTVRDSVAAHKNAQAFDAGGTIATPTELNLENSVVTETDGIGLLARSSATIRASNVMITDNGTGVSSGGETIVSWGNNRLAGNGTDVMFSSTISQA